MIYDIDDRFHECGNWKYGGETIREVLHKDSGYIKDLIMKRIDFSLSDSCMEEAKKITKGKKETWKRPSNPKMIFDELKPYAVPYDFDFNNVEVLNKNENNKK